ncbi:choice-of-anchor J domain-containing protein [Mangrovimonas sp. AS39]|uniref:T9SS-dependent choice-of-anchor J family protein n=1 Tax=Mangrovimonas futianensis TaxID=2895523 RepID=UPI001E550AC4|nr:choice-of-anchor J domain-containing protein [Mangrovimonas futianensis]MCF1192913.1 choice-of-anchor J domain-containing protein [Mangrovimonas futianensis]MCF1196485.1 choice-of-anchor J domain-containing protein [Mangrovimonas futianensis]
MRKNYFRVAKRFASAAFLTTVFGLATFASKNPSPNKSEMNPIMDPADFVTFSLSGLNADVIANGVGAAAEVTTNDVDGVNWCFLEMGYQDASFGLPVGGLITSPNTTDLSFQFASYDADNSLRIPASGDVNFPVTIAETGSYETIYFAATTGSGSSTFSGTIDFQDGSTQAFSDLSVSDWYNGSNYIISGIGRVNRDDETLENGGTWTLNPRIYEIGLDIDPANQSKTVTGITVTNVTAGGTSANITLNIFAISGKLAADCPVPTDLALGTVGAYDAEISWTPFDVNDTFEVAVVLDGAGEPVTGDDTTDQSTYTFTNLTPETAYDAYIRTVCQTTGFSYWVGPLSFTTTIACPAPTNLSAAATSTTEASASWDMGTASAWEVAYVLNGDPEPTSGDATVTNSFDFSSLEPATTYTVYVRADCGVDGYSTWTTTNFTTWCDALPGIDEDFEGDSIPACWTIINGGDSNTWFHHNSTTYANSGSKSMRITYSSAAHEDYLITPAFTVTDHVSDMISFWARNYSSSYVDEFDVLVSTTGNSEADFTEVLATNVGPGTSYTEYTYDLSAYVGETIYFAIKAISTNEWHLNIDDVLTYGSPYCDAPSDLDAIVTPTSATLNWSGPSEDGYEIAVQATESGEPSSGMVVSEASYEESLTYGEIKEFYVRTICTGGGYSPWSGPFTFGSYTTLETSGYTDDVIANGVGASASSTTNDIDGGNFAYFSKDFDPTGSNLVSVGLPLNGVLNSPNTSGLSFELQSYGDNNSLRMPTASEGGTLTVTNAYPAETLYLSVVSGGGSGSMSGTIHFNDGSTQAIPTTAVSDWYNGGNYVIAGIGRVNTTNDNVETPNNNPRIYEMAVALEEGNYTKTITSIDFQKETGGVINVFAASIKFSEEAGLSVNEQTLVNVTMYPNPVKEQLFVKGMDVQTVDVFTVLGQRVAVDFNENVINVSNLSQGVYFVTVNAVQGSKTFRIIKQ